MADMPTNWRVLCYVHGGSFSPELGAGEAETERFRAVVRLQIGPSARQHFERQPQSYLPPRTYLRQAEQH